MQDIICAVIYSTAPANFWVPPPQKFHYVRIVERKNTTCFPNFSVGRGFISRRKTHKQHGYNLCHTIFCHPEPEPFKGRTENEPKDLCRETATTTLDGEIKNVPSKKYRECDFVADSSRSFSVLPLTSLLLRMTF